MIHARSQSNSDDEHPAKRSRTQPIHTAIEFTAQSLNHSSESINRSSESIGQSPESIDQSTESITQSAELLPDLPSDRSAIGLLMYPFLLPLVVDCLCDRDVLARLLIIHKSIRLVLPKYTIKKMLSDNKALRIIRASRDITFSVARVKCEYDQGLIEVHRNNSAPLKEAHCNVTFDPNLVIPQCVTHLGSTYYDRAPVLVGMIPNTVVELDLKNCVPVVGSIPSSAKRLSMRTDLGNLDSAVIPSTVTDLGLKYFDQRWSFLQRPIRCIFPSSLRHLCLSSYRLPIAPGLIPSSVLKFECSSEMLSNLEVGTIPDSVKEMKIEWNRRFVPKAGVLPDSVIHIVMSSRLDDANVIPPWPMPAHLTSLQMNV